MSITNDNPQTWLFPPSGGGGQPEHPGASFGPISKGDQIELSWTPANQKPEVTYICGKWRAFSLPSDSTSRLIRHTPNKQRLIHLFVEAPQAQDAPTIQTSVSQNNASPFQWTFDRPSDDPGRFYLCWFYFAGVQNANTVSFNFSSTPSSGGSVQWRPNAQFSAAVAATTGTAPASTVTAAAATITAAAATITASGDPGPSSNGLSAGAAAGIGVGITTAAALAALAALLWFMRRKKARADVARQSGEPGIEKPPPTLANPRQRSFLTRGTSETIVSSQEMSAIRSPMQIHTELL